MVNRFDTYQHVLDEIRSVKNLRSGFVTNFFPDISKHSIWINDGDFYYIKIEDTLFLFRNRKDFINLFYCSPSQNKLFNNLPILNALMTGKNLVVDLIGKKSDVNTLKGLFKKCNFYEYANLGRMSKASNKLENKTFDLRIRIAGLQHTDSIQKLLYTYFDPIAEQLPAKEEIINWLQQEHVSIFEQKGIILGFIIYDIIGLTSYLKYWFVHPEHRDKKIGSALLYKFFSDSEKTKRQLFWVIQSNNNAIMRYKHYGFFPENMFDIVMTNKNQKYEAKSN